MGLFVSVGDAAAGQIVGRDFHLHPVAGKNSDVVLAHLATQMPEHLVAVVEFNAKMATFEGFDSFSLKQDGVVFDFRHAVSLIGDE